VIEQEEVPAALDDVQRRIRQLARQVARHRQRCAPVVRAMPQMNWRPHIREPEAPGSGCQPQLGDESIEALG
jgi:hypothetical protein